jgi:hypothetical protein
MNFKSIDKKHRFIPLRSWSETLNVPESLWRKNTAEEPMMTVKCDSPVRVRVIWEGGEKVIG